MTYKVKKRNVAKRAIPEYSTRLTLTKVGETIFKTPQAIHSPQNVYDFIWPLIKDRANEVFVSIYLNTAHKILSWEINSIGGVSSSFVDPAVVFRAAILQNASCIICVHNHPSGKLLASEADKEVTKKLKLAGQQMDIIVLDHVIITENGFFSFNDEGIF